MTELARPTPTSTLTSSSGLLHVGAHLRLVVAGRDQAVLGGAQWPNLTLILSRSTGSSARPTAMTIRPQLASSPAKAVLTSGLSQMVRAILRAEAAVSAPVTVTLMNFRRALAVADQLLGQVQQHLLQLVAEVGQPAVAGAADRGAPDAPVANSSRVSLVERSPSTVTALKVLRV